MPEPFKNLLNEKLARELGSLVRRSYPAFPYEAFLERSLPRLESLELKERAQLLGESLWSTLPAPKKRALGILLQATRSLPPASEGPDSGSGWLLYPLNAILERHGPSSFRTGLQLAYELTRRFTAEFGIRSFLQQKPKETLAVLARWARDPDPHARRLVSEGSRPRLPWASQLPAFIQDPRPILPLLEILKDDPSDYVRRSVANNLNDISKDHPELMLDVAQRWLRDAPEPRQRLLKRACRTLVKAGHPRCLVLLGFPPPQVEVTGFTLAPGRLVLGETLVASATLRSLARHPQAIVADFRFHFVKAKGSTAPKVFKGVKLSLGPQQSHSLRRSFPLKPVTTRRYYPGLTRVELVLNGQACAAARFELALPSS